MTTPRPEKIAICADENVLCALLLLSPLLRDCSTALASASVKTLPFRAVVIVETSGMHCE